MESFLVLVNILEMRSLSLSTSYFLFLVVQFTLKVIGNMMMSLEPAGEEQEKFRANFKLISSSFASLPIKIPGTAFYRGIKVTFTCSYIN